MGPTNNGKTAIAERFLRDHPQRSSEDGEHEIFPVLLVQMPPAPTVSRLYAAILARLGVPSGLHPRWPDREGAALNLLRRVECRMLVIDELHNLVAASIPRQREFLNLLRYLGNELRIPLACLGTREAYLVIRTDDQLENRFEPFLLPSWEDGAEFGRLLASFEAVLPLREPSGLGLPAMRAAILRRSEGTIGEVAALLAAATETVLLGGQERIDATSLEAAGYQPPTVVRERVAVSGALVDRAQDRRWPLHPQPREWEDLQTWVRRIADMYEVSYDAFLLNPWTTQGAARAIWIRRPSACSQSCPPAPACRSNGCST